MPNDAGPASTGQDVDPLELSTCPRRAHPLPEPCETRQNYSSFRRSTTFEREAVGRSPAFATAAPHTFHSSNQTCRSVH